jgi:hypothetical protein
MATDGAYFGRHRMRRHRGGMGLVAQPLAPCGPWTKQLLSFRFADLFRRLLQQKPCQLRRLDRNLTLLSNLGRQLG